MFNYFAITLFCFAVCGTGISQSIEIHVDNFTPDDTQETPSLGNVILEIAYRDECTRKEKYTHVLLDEFEGKSHDLGFDHPMEVKVKVLGTSVEDRMYLYLSPNETIAIHIDMASPEIDRKSPTLPVYTKRYRFQGESGEFQKHYSFFKERERVGTFESSYDISYDDTQRMFEDDSEPFSDQVRKYYGKLVREEIALIDQTVGDFPRSEELKRILHDFVRYECGENDLKRVKIKTPDQLDDAAKSAIDFYHVFESKDVFLNSFEDFAQDLVSVLIPSMSNTRDVMSLEEQLKQLDPSPIWQAEYDEIMKRLEANPSEDFNDFFRRIKQNSPEKADVMFDEINEVMDRVSEHQKFLAKMRFAIELSIPEELKFSFLSGEFSQSTQKNIFHNKEAVTDFFSNFTEEIEADTRNVWEKSYSEERTAHDALKVYENRQKYLPYAEIESEYRSVLNSHKGKVVLAFTMGHNYKARWASLFSALAIKLEKKYGDQLVCLMISADRQRGDRKIMSGNFARTYQQYGVSNAIVVDGKKASAWIEPYYGFNNIEGIQAYQPNGMRVESNSIQKDLQFTKLCDLIDQALLNKNPTKNEKITSFQRAVDRGLTVVHDEENYLILVTKKQDKINIAAKTTWRSYDEGKTFIEKNALTGESATLTPKMNATGDSFTVENDVNSGNPKTTYRIVLLGRDLIVLERMP